jgi:uncharacterized protein YbjT (DUF2867 family)
MTPGHWAWHQFVERYIEWSGFFFTHLRPQDFMQNLLSYGGKKVIEMGCFIIMFRSWVDVDNVAEVAALTSVSRIACRQNVQTWL